jgi:hypothetical protein
MTLTQYKSFAALRILGVVAAIPNMALYRNAGYSRVVQRANRAG